MEKYMEIVGYNKKEIFSGHLNEATITFSYEELKEIAAFLNNIIEKHYDTDPKCLSASMRLFKVMEKNHLLI